MTFLGCGDGEKKVLLDSKNANSGLSSVENASDSNAESQASVPLVPLR